MDMNIDPDEPTKVNILSALWFANVAGLSDACTRWSRPLRHNFAVVRAPTDPSSALVRDGAARENHITNSEDYPHHHHPTMDVFTFQH